MITVGKTNGNHADTTVPVDTLCFYSTCDSFSCSSDDSEHRLASVASAAVLLIEVGGQNPNWSSAFTTNRAGTTIYNAQRSETIKALLMAGASRLTINSVANGDIDDYRQDNALQTDNGLDWRYGAGQLNVQHSYQILSATEQASQQDGEVSKSKPRDLILIPLSGAAMAVTQWRIIT